MVTLTSHDVAVRQLNHAISLFLNMEEIVSAITLAGAAEEILGKLAQEAGHTPSLKRKTSLRRNAFVDVFGRDCGDKPFADHMNKTRNSFKHSPKEAIVKCDLQQEAIRMLDRAIENYKLLHPRRSPLIVAYEKRRIELWRQKHDQQ